MEEIIDLIPQIAGLITACGTIVLAIKKWLINPLELSCIKTDLVNFINDVESGTIKSEIQKMNAHEMFDRYTKLGGNSYVHEHWSKLEKEGKV